jgi:hypothetical protein
VHNPRAGNFGVRSTAAVRGQDSTETLRIISERVVTVGDLRFPEARSTLSLSSAPKAEGNPRGTLGSDQWGTGSSPRTQVETVVREPFRLYAAFVSGGAVVRAFPVISTSEGYEVSDSV